MRYFDVPCQAWSIIERCCVTGRLPHIQSLQLCFDVGTSDIECESKICFSAYRIGSYRHMLNTMLETLKHFVYGQGQTCWDVLRLWGSHHIPSGDTMIHQVRESQTNSLYDRDWNRPQFGAPRELGWGQALSKCWIHVRVSYPTGDEKPKIDVIFIESV